MDTCYTVSSPFAGTSYSTVQNDILPPPSGATLSTLSCSVPSVSVTHPFKLKILFWNVHGNLPVLLTDPEFCALLYSHDVCLLQETHVLGDFEDSLPIPPDFIIYTKNCAYRDDMARPGGGVANIAHANLNLSLRKDLS